MKGTVVHINGGLGKCIMFTAVARAYKQQYPDLHLIVVSGYPEVFINNPNIDGNFSFNQHGLWPQLYKKEVYEVMAWDPYFHEDWIKNKPRHLIDIWAELLDVDCFNLIPELYFSGPEVGTLQRMITAEKPLLVVQSTGGSNPAAMSWTRNPAKGELEELLSKYAESHYIVHLAVPETPHLNWVHQRVETLNRRQAMCLVYYSQEFIGIDSFGLHARAANPNAGPTQFIFPLPEMVDRIGYKESGHIYHIPRPEVQQILDNSYGYYSTVQKFTIEESDDNCPIPVGMKWFDFS